MSTIALVGAGGKMGCRITDNMKNQPAYRMLHVEVAPAGLANLAQARGRGRARGRGGARGRLRRPGRARQPRRGDLGPGRARS